MKVKRDVGYDTKKFGDCFYNEPGTGVIIVFLQGFIMMFDNMELKDFVRIVITIFSVALTF